MKVVVHISRILVGSLFVFSGLVKAIDPKGLSYKMQEFFEVWAADGFLPKLMGWFNQHSLLFSIVMITLEVILGVALLVGWQKKGTTVLLLLLTIFFTFLTAFVLFTGKIRACGCFGDCIPLTPIQTFTKDIILLALILVLLFGKKHILPLFKNTIGFAIVLASLIGVLFLQWYVQSHLPLKDCLPFKAGNNILELRKMPKDAVADKFDYTFIYQKNGQNKEFGVSNLPDSTWQFIDRKQVLVQKGKNNIPLINDFSFTTESGKDTTEAILGQQGEYYLMFVKDFDEKKDTWYKDFKDFYFNNAIPVYLITSDYATAKKIFLQQGHYKIDVFTCDGTAIKTAARVNPTLYKMKGAIVQNKWSWEDAKNIPQKRKPNGILTL